MPYVPCSPGQTFSTSPVLSSRVRTYDTSSGKLIGDVVSNYATTRSTFASKSATAKGPRRALLGKLWSPCRSYSRSAAVFLWTPVSCELLSTDKKQRQIWQGFPQSGGILTATTGHINYVTGPEYSFDASYVPSLSTQSLSRINTGLLQKAGDRKVNFGNNIGESRETIKMLCYAVKNLFRAYIAARKGNFGAVARFLKHKRLRFPSGKTIAEKWLAYIYGWKPLMQDIYDSYKLLRDGLQTKPQLLHVTRKISAVNESSGYASTVASSSVARTTAQMMGKMWFRIADNDLNRLNQFGLINPAEVAWEVLPFSFVVDWFVPVSSYLEALSARVGLTFVDGYYGIKLEGFSQLSGYNPVRSGWTYVSSSGGTRFEVSGYKRTVMTSLPWPDLWFKSPFSTTHVANALALLRTLWR